MSDDLLAELNNHIRQSAPHQHARKSYQLLSAAASELSTLRAELGQQRDSVVRQMDSTVREFLRAEAAESRLARVKQAVRNVLCKDVTLLTADDVEVLERALTDRAAQETDSEGWSKDPYADPVPHSKSQYKPGREHE